MDAATLFGLCAALLVGIGVYALIVNPQPLRKLIAFNVLGGGVFLLFGAIARRGAGRQRRWQIEMNDGIYRTLFAAYPDALLLVDLDEASIAL